MCALGTETYLRYVACWAISTGSTSTFRSSTPWPHPLPQRRQPCTSSTTSRSIRPCGPMLTTRASAAAGDPRSLDAGWHQRPRPSVDRREDAPHRQLVACAADHVHAAQRLGALRPGAHLEPARVLRREVPLPVAVQLPMRDREL